MVFISSLMPCSKLWYWCRIISPLQLEGGELWLPHPKPISEGIKMLPALKFEQWINYCNVASWEENAGPFSVMPSPGSGRPLHRAEIPADGSGSKQGPNRACGGRKLLNSRILLGQWNNDWFHLFKSLLNISWAWQSKSGLSELVLQRAR